MLELQTNQISEMESQLNYITQKVDFHREKVARREVALLTSAKTSARQPKVLAPANKEKQSRYIRKAIDYSLLDDIGHGVRTVPSNSHPIYRTGSSVTSVSNNSSGGHRLSGIQTLGPKNSISSHYQQGGHQMQQAHYNTLGGGGNHQPPPTSKPPTPPQAARGLYGTLGRSSAASKEYRAGMGAPPPPIAPPQVPKNYEPNYPIGHPKSALTAQRSGSLGPSSYSTLPPGSINQHHPNSIYGGSGTGSQLYGYSGGASNGMSGSSINSNSSQYGGGMMMAGGPGPGMMSSSMATPPPPPPMMSQGDSNTGALPDPPPPPPSSMYDSRNSTGEFDLIKDCFVY